MKRSKHTASLEEAAQFYGVSVSQLVSDFTKWKISMDLEKEEVETGQLYQRLSNGLFEQRKLNRQTKHEMVDYERRVFISDMQICERLFVRTELTRGGMMVFRHLKNRKDLLRVLVYVSTSTMKNDKVAFRINHLAKKENPPDWVACIAVPFGRTWMFKREFLFERSGGKNTYSIYLNKDDYEEWDVNHALRELSGVE